MAIFLAGSSAAQATGGGSTDLRNGVSVGNLEIHEYQVAYFRLPVPSGVDELTFETSGGYGYLNLFVKYGSQATPTSYHCRSDGGGTHHSCSFDFPAAGDWYVALQGWCSFADVTLVGRYDGGGYSSVTELQNGVPVGGLAGAPYEALPFRLQVPAGFDELIFEISGGSGSPALYVKRGAEPTESSYDCRSWITVDGGICSFDSPTAGDWYVAVRAVSSFSGVTLVGSYQESGGGGGKSGVVDLQNGVPVYGLTGSPSDELYFRLQVPSGVDELSFETGGGSGDADLYVKRGALPTTLDYDCRPWMDGNDEGCSFDSPSGGDWYVMVRGYASFSGVVLVGSYQENGGGGISEWMGHSVFKASAKKLGKTSWEGTSQMAFEGNGTFTYTDPKGTMLTGPVSQDGKKLYMALDNGSIAVLEEKMADMVWDEMMLSGLNPGWVDVDIDPWSIKLKAKQKPAKNGNRGSIKVKLSVKAWIDTGIGSSKGKLQAKMTLYEP
jgi:hypothetical protein